MVGGFPSEGNNKDSKDISVSRLNILNGFNESFALFDEGGELISGHINSVEGGDSLSALSLVDNKFDFAPVEGVLSRGEIGLHLSNNSTLDAVFDFL